MSSLSSRTVDRTVTVVMFDESTPNGAPDAHALPNAQTSNAAMSMNKVCG
ncbi:MAG: hypothetical protein JKX70_00590 [Phycisphaerales bacterium]|nr:hypothetical protein [Phycisphaerales bacterium]